MTASSDFLIREARPEDVPVILRMIKALAEYQKLSGAVTTTEAQLRDSLFEKRAAEVLLAWAGAEPAGFAVFFHNFSTFLGRPGMYLEDLFVPPEWRGRGLGKQLFARVARMAVERGCGRMEWSVLDWNDPAIRLLSQARRTSDGRVDCVSLDRRRADRGRNGGRGRGLCVQADVMAPTARHFTRWREFEDAVANEAAALEARWKLPTAVPFFRGHPSTDFDLLPSLLRPHGDRWFTPEDERSFYYEFLSRGGSVVPPGLDSWDILFLMRHHGVPTRLLDWSESFAAAIFFALPPLGERRDLDLWFLDPYALNREMFGTAAVLDVRVNLKHSYFDYYVETKAMPEWKHAVAIYPQPAVGTPLRTVCDVHTAHDIGTAGAPGVPGPQPLHAGGGGPA